MVKAPTVVKAIIVFGSLVFIWNVLSACTFPGSNEQAPLPDGYARRWLQKIPCAAPCWEGITPGTTTVDDAVPLLKSNPNINPNSVSINTDLSHEGIVWWAWKGDSIKTEDGQAYFDSDLAHPVISDISPTFFESNATTFTLNDVIPVYGQPTAVYATTCVSQATQEVLYRVNVEFGLNGIDLGILNSYREKPAIDANLRFDTVSFVEPTSSRDAEAQPWHGFDTFDAYKTVSHCG